MPFVGRGRELAALERTYDTGRFQMAVVYGRRRIGKTALIRRFCQGKPTLWFTAREQSPANNLRELSRRIFDFFHETGWPGGFPDWDTALAHIADKATDPTARPFVFVFDEFPYAAEGEPSLPSAMQIAIDHRFKETRITMILCGSNEGFMEGRVLGYKSPLYGRRTAQLHLKPLGIADAIRLMPADATWEDRVRYYATLGGTPYHLEQLAEGVGFARNITNLCYSMSGILYEEPMMLLRQELREPALYNSILEAIAAGETKPKGIGERVGMERTALGPYLSTLSSLGLAERVLPFGAKPHDTRRGLWRVGDPFFAYWYQFVGPHSGMVDGGDGEGAAAYGTSGQVFDTYVGQRFEDLCAQWVLDECRAGRIGLTPTQRGRWWGTDPDAHEQADIDVVMRDDINGRVLLGECKWRESFNETAALGKLRARAWLAGGPGERMFWLFSKRPLSGATMRRVGTMPDMHVVDAATMFGGPGGR